MRYKEEWMTVKEETSRVFDGNQRGLPFVLKRDNIIQYKSIDRVEEYRCGRCLSRFKRSAHGGSLFEPQSRITPVQIYTYNNNTSACETDALRWTRATPGQRQQ